MASRKPLVIGSDGLPQALQDSDTLAGGWSKQIQVAVGGSVSLTIPAGYFAALPVIAHSIQATGTRDYVFRLSSLTLNADTSVSLTGIVRESRILAVLGDTFGSLSSAVTLHLFARRSD